MQFLGCLFVLLFGVLLVIVAFLGSFINAVLSFFGLKNRVRYKSHAHSSYGSSQDADRSQERQQQGPGYSGSQNGSQPGGKIFQKDDSEYVDFEEIK